MVAAGDWRECLTLRVKDIDFERNCLTIRAGKGSKDRETVLPEKVISDIHRHLMKIHRFEFAVTSGPLAVARWRYEFEHTDTGCRVTESWEDQRKRWFVVVARVMGDHSAAHAETEMATTLANLAAAAE